MLFHATIRYDRSENPTSSVSSLTKLVDYRRWMDEQSQFDVKVIAVHWGTAEPIGFGVVDSPSEDTLRAFLSLMPGEPAISIDPIEPLSDAYQDGIDQLLHATERGARA
jgi:hypothetical protein